MSPPYEKCRDITGPCRANPMASTTLLPGLTACGAATVFLPPKVPTLSVPQAEQLCQAGSFAPGLFNVLPVSAVRHAYSASRSTPPPGLASLAGTDLVVECSTSGALGQGSTVLLTSGGTRLGPGSNVR